MPPYERYSQDLRISKNNDRYEVIYRGRKLKSFNQKDVAEAYTSDTMLEEYYDLIEEVSQKENEKLAYLPSRDKLFYSLAETAKYFNVQERHIRKALSRHKPEIKHIIVNWCNSQDCKNCRRFKKCSNEEK